jgi:hypothetical protein
VDQASADRWGQGDPHLRGGHRSGDGPVHLSAAFDVAPVRKRCVTSRAGIEVFIVLKKELKNRRIRVGHA